MHKRKSGVLKRALTGLLAIALLISLFPTTFAAAAYEEDYSSMLKNNLAVNGLAYLGYDFDGLIEDKQLFQIWTGDAIKPYLTDVFYKNDCKASGRETVDAPAGVKTATGKIPNVDYFETVGLNCGGFATYYYYNYLVNIEGMDISALTKRLPSGAHDPKPWATALNNMVKDGTAELMIDLKNGQNSSDVPYSIWNELNAGDILIFRQYPTEENSFDYDWAHICIFAGMFPCKDKGVIPWMIHQSSSKGACMVPVYSIEGVNNGAGEKNNQELNLIYKLKMNEDWEPYGTLKVHKVDESGNALPGAYFAAVNSETGIVYPFPATDSAGYAELSELPLGTYSVKEVTAPANYQLSKQIWTLELDEHGATVAFTAVNYLEQGYISVQKTDEFGHTLSGVEFTVYSDPNCTKAICSMTTNDDGVATSAALDCTKTYYVKETKTQHSDYILDETVRSVVVPAKDTAWINNGEAVINYLKNGAVGIMKETEGGKPMEGVLFGVYSDAECTQLLERIETDENGHAVFGMSGTEYTLRCRQTVYFKELKTDDDYVLDTNVYPVTVYASTTTYANNGKPVINYLKTGAVGIKKVDEAGNALSGVTFGVYSDANCSTLLSYIVTNENGHAIYGVNEETGEYTVKCQQTLYIREVAPKDNSYMYDDTIYPVSVCADTVTYANNNQPVVNEKKQWKVVVNKVDSGNGELGVGSASVVGAEYGLFDAAGNKLATYTVGKDGTFTTAAFAVGSGYYLQETKAPKGYKLDPTKYNLDDYSAPVEENIKVTTYNMTLNEEVVTGTVSLKKFTANRYAPNDFVVPEEGAEFRIYWKESGSFAQAAATGDTRLYDIGVANADGNIVWSNGQIVSNELAYGTFVVTQTKSWDNRIFVEDFEVDITGENQHFDLSLNNPYYSASLVVVKKDAESKKTITTSSAVFKIMDLTENMYVTYVDPDTGDEISEFATVDGVMTLPMELPYGQFRLEEVKAPNGYLLNAQGWEFTIDSNSPTVITHEFYNEPAKSCIELHKKGDQFVSVQNVSTPYGTMLTPTYEYTYLANATFDVIAAEDIYGPDGSLKYARGTVVDTLTTVASGPVYSVELFPGTFQVVETSAPAGYLYSADPVAVTLTNSESEGLAVVRVDIGNELIGTEIALLKRASTWRYTSKSSSDPNFEHTTDREIVVDPGEGFTFGVFAAEEFTAQDGQTISANSLVCYGLTDKNGMLIYDQQLPFGNYYVVELDAPDAHAYILDTTHYTIDLSLANAENNKVTAFVNNGEAITNDFVRINVVIKKTDLTSSEPVAGALITIRNHDTNRIVYRLYTDETGVMPGLLLEPGRYIFTEDVAPAGYIRSPESFEFVVHADGTIEGTTEFTNEQTVIELTKADADTNEPVANATIHVFDSAGNLVYVGTTDINGRLVITGVLNTDETYTFVEASAPEGYSLNATVFTFNVNSDGTVSGSTTITNEKTQFKVIKVDPDGLALAGAEFTMYDENGNVLDVQVTNEFGEAIFTGFGWGTFTIKETKAPEGYQLSVTDITITNNGTWNNDEEYAKITVVNYEKIPQTGDIDHYIPAFATIGFVAAVALYVIVLAQKKNNVTNEDAV